MKTQIHIGTSSYNNRLWQPLFYPEELPRSRWFDYYCEHFSTYELNVTFYKFPTVRTLQNWYKKAPNQFRFSVKAPKSITHIKRFDDCATDLQQFYSIVREGLMDKLACVLFQLPPSFSYSAEKLQLILEHLNPEFTNAVEFRNDSWWREDVFAAFRKYKVIFCNVSYTGLKETIVTTHTTGYLRLHGTPLLFYSGYSDETIAERIAEIRLQPGLDDFYVYFNNTAGLEGIANALLAKKLG